jgi:hypothetical protein
MAKSGRILFAENHKFPVTSLNTTMALKDPYNLQLQVSRMFRDGQSFFAAIKVQEWLKERQHDPALYDVLFHKAPAAPGSGLVEAVTIELKRKDGEPVDLWLLEEINRSA